MYLKKGKAAELVLYDLNDVAYAGCHNPMVGLLVTCWNSSLVKMTMVNGKVVIKDGKLLTMDSGEITVKAHKISSDIVKK